MKTEDEARKMCCCGPVQAGRRLDTGARVGADIDGAPIYERLCIASECMAWREEWATAQFADGDPYRTGKGYCGLAGKP